MKGRNTVAFGIRLPDGLFAMVKLSAELSGKTMSEHIRDRLAADYPEWRDRRWEEVEDNGGN